MASGGRDVENGDNVIDAGAGAAAEVIVAVVAEAAESEGAPKIRKRPSVAII